MSSPFVLINTFTVAPENQQRLIDLLIEITNESIVHIEGFITSTLHQSVDGTKVTMYAQWTSREAYEEMRKRPVASSALTEALSFATFEMGMYDIVQVFQKQ